MPSVGAPLRDLTSAVRQQTASSTTDHRPWPMPARRWLMGQTWIDLLFAHWRVDSAQLSRVLPPGLEPDMIDGSAWIGATPFEVRALRFWLTLPAPLVSAFPELNVRTYVTVAGKPGIYFLSLDADSRLAVAAARRAYRFPYFRAQMSVRRRAGAIHYSSERDPSSGPPARFRATYEPRGEPFNAAPESRAWKLIERYCAYTLDDKGRILRAEIHHRPWQLYRAEAQIAENSMTAPLGIDLEGDPLLHLAPRQDVAIWPHEIAREVSG
jgi:uncharacterized protein